MASFTFSTFSQKYTLNLSFCLPAPVKIIDYIMIRHMEITLINVQSSHGINNFKIQSPTLYEVK